MDAKHQVPIWFFVGGTLLIYGLIIVGVGICSLIWPSLEPGITAASGRVAVWWGGWLTAIGTFYVVRYWPWRKQV
jgi:hypothetical protein